MSDESKPGPPLEALLQQLAGEGLSSAQWQELNHLLLKSAEARREYLRFQYLHARLATLAWEPAEHLPFPVTPAAGHASEPADAELQKLIEKIHALEATRVSTLAPSANEGVSPSPTRSVSEAAPSPPSIHIPHSTFRISAIAAVVACIAIGILTYAFWPSPAVLPVVQQTPAAKIANLTDAQWAGADSHAGDTLNAGQRLVLHSGSAEITFNSQARVVLEGPAELIVVDAAACRLARGKLTAQVPDPAKGFQVHTPDGTVTDLGTEFGVYVKTGPEIVESSVPEEQTETSAPQPVGKQPPVTEVHVFVGKVDVTQSEQLSQAPKDAKSSEPSPIVPRPSHIVTAGHAVTISENKVQPLPAADPFKFAIDKLNGRPRTMLLSEDFETYHAGNNVEAIGPWTVQSGTRKGQGIRILDAPDMLSQYKTEAGDPYPNLTPSPPTGGRFVFIACASPNRPETYPILAREIDGKLLTRNGQVLIEFDILQNSTGPFEPSLALAAKVEHTAGIELGRDGEGKKIEWLPYQCYRLRLLLNVMDGTVREVRADRLHWRGPQSWVRDLTFVPAAKFDWSTPPRYVIFGFPVVSGTTAGSLFWLDNVRIEVIAEK